MVGYYLHSIVGRREVILTTSKSHIDILLANLSHMALEYDLEKFTPLHASGLELLVKFKF